jgi:Protein of unknown function (DUF2786)
MTDTMPEKVRKLLAKAEDPGCTAEKAEALNDEAAELIAKYGVDLALLAAASPETDRSGTASWPSTRRTHWTRRVCSRPLGLLVTKVAIKNAGCSGMTTTCGTSCARRSPTICAMKFRRSWRTVASTCTACLSWFGQPGGIGATMGSMTCTRRFTRSGQSTSRCLVTVAAVSNRSSFLSDNNAWT